MSLGRWTTFCKPTALSQIPCQRYIQRDDHLTQLIRLHPQKTTLDFFKLVELNYFVLKSNLSKANTNATIYM